MNAATDRIDVADLATLAAILRRSPAAQAPAPAWSAQGQPPVGSATAIQLDRPATDAVAVEQELRPGGLPADPAEWTVLEGLLALAERRLASREWLEALLRQIHRAEPAVGAWVTVLAPTARTAAEAADAGRAAGQAQGLLAGVPMGIKDIFFIASVPCGGGSRSRAGFVPGETAAAVSQLQAAGAVIVGTTATMEFAFGDAAPTRNPWHPEHTPGGSSSGSAAAVAARMVPATLGSQAAGSITRPAAYCGITGLKPTFGLVPTAGAFPTSWTNDHVGPLVRSAADAAVLFQALAGARALRLPGIGMAGLRIGIPDRFYFEVGEPAVSEAAQAALETLQQSGAQLVPLRLPASFEAAQVANTLTVYAEWAAYHRDAAAANPEGYGPISQRRITAGLTIPADAYLAALRVRATFGAELLAAMQAVDLLATPSASTPAPRSLTFTGNPSFNAAFTLAGFPTLGLPAGFTADGLPLGLQLVAKPCGEATLLRAGHTFQAATDWHLRRPPVCG